MLSIIQQVILVIMKRLLWLQNHSTAHLIYPRTRFTRRESELKIHSKHHLEKLQHE